VAFTGPLLQSHGYPGENDCITLGANPGRAYPCHVYSPVLRSMQAFITVGSTKFDGLIDVIASEDFLTALSASGYTRLVIQYGNSKVRQPFRNGTSHGVEVITWSFKPSLSEEYLAADLVISHAGLRSIPRRVRSLTTRARFWDHSGSVEVEQTIDRRGERDFAGQSPERACRSSFCPGASRLVNHQVNLSISPTANAVSSS